MNVTLEEPLAPLYEKMSHWPAQQRAVHYHFRDPHVLQNSTAMALLDGSFLYGCIGRFLLEKGDYQESFYYHSKSFAVGRLVFPPESILHVHTYNGIGNVYAKEKAYKKPSHAIEALCT